MPTFGDITQGQSIETNAISASVLGTFYILNGNDVMVPRSISWHGLSQTGKAKCAIYVRPTGMLNWTYVVETEELNNCGTDALHTHNILSYAELAGKGTYALLVMLPGQSQFRYAALTVGNGLRVNQTYGIFPPSLTLTTDNHQHSIYCTYDIKICTSGATICSGPDGPHALYRCQNNQWVLVNPNSPICGYACNDGDTQCQGYDLYVCSGDTWGLAEINSSSCGYSQPPARPTDDIEAFVINVGEPVSGPGYEDFGKYDSYGDTFSLIDTYTLQISGMLRMSSGYVIRSGSWQMFDLTYNINYQEIEKAWCLDGAGGHHSIGFIRGVDLSGVPVDSTTMEKMNLNTDGVELYTRCYVVPGAAKYFNQNYVVSHCGGVSKTLGDALGGSGIWTCNADLNHPGQPHWAILSLSGHWDHVGMLFARSQYTTPHHLSFYVSETGASNDFTPLTSATYLSGCSATRYIGTNTPQCATLPLGGAYLKMEIALSGNENLQWGCASGLGYVPMFWANNLSGDSYCAYALRLKDHTMTGAHGANVYGTELSIQMTSGTVHSGTILGANYTVHMWRTIETVVSGPTTYYGNRTWMEIWDADTGQYLPGTLTVAGSGRWTSNPSAMELQPYNYFIPACPRGNAGSDALRKFAGVVSDASISGWYQTSGVIIDPET